MIRVDGLRDGRVVVSFDLAHGHDVAAGLSARGWVGDVVAAVRDAAGDLTLSYAVRPALALPETARLDAPLDPGLSAADVAAAVRHQRVAAYAVVRSARGILLTQLAATTNAAGQWNLPGGGLEAGEQPLDGLVREVHEETGQRVEDVRIVGVLTRHWVGRAPHGAVEDFHAVRLVHTATCPEPADPVVHDVGGSTAQARWVDAVELAGLPLASSTPEALRLAGVGA